MAEIKEGFWEDICSFSKRLAKEEDFLVVSHHDADGVTACAITVDLLDYLGKKREYMVIKQLDSTTISRVKEMRDKTVVFTDMGSGQLALLEENGIREAYIIDHHQPERDYKRQINPHTYGYDGGREISASGMAYLVAKSLGNTRMVHLAVVGAVGDMQDSDGSLLSLNKMILEEGIGKGVLKMKCDLRLFGRQSRPLTQMLAYASEPVLPGLTGDEAACGAFIEGLGIRTKEGERWRTYVDLSREERKTLTSALYMHLLDCGTPEYIVQGIVGEVYTLLGEEKRSELRDAKEYATVLNACGRQGQPEIGVAVCLGDRGMEWGKAKAILKKHRTELREGIMLLKQKGVEERKNYYFFDAKDTINENIIGVVAGMVYGARIVPPDKPIFAFADDRESPGMMKVSARANWDLVRAGLHLGKALRETTKDLGGEGGGHNIAAGARVPKENREALLMRLDEKIGAQLRRS